MSSNGRGAASMNEPLFSDQSDDEEKEPAGYCRPPRATRFRKGQSGNPKGRPRGRRSEIPYDGVLGQMVTVKEDGKERRITAAEAFILQLTQKGLAGDSAAARASLEAIETARAKRHADHPPIGIICIKIIADGIDTILDDLNLAVKRFPRDEERVRWELQPWIVEAALKRLGKRQLSPAEQREVWSNTRTPQKVLWPEWWTFRG